MDQVDSVADATDRQPSATARGGRHLYLVDGSGYIFRAYHALPPMTRGDGTPINAVYGFTNMLIKLLEDTQAERLAVIFDASEHTFRNELYAEYKANRDEAPDELKPQFSIIREAVRAFNVPCIELAGFEADDLIASYAKAAVAAGDDVVVVSSDKDLMQLVSDKVAMLDPIKNRKIGAAEVMERFGVGPDKVIHVQALCGDPTDNVPGVRGIGVKTAAELINTYGDLDGLYQHVDEIKQPKRRETLKENEANARISLTLVTLKDDIELPMPIDALVKRAPDTETLRAFFQQQEFRKLIERLDGGLIVRGAESGAPVPAPPGDVVEKQPARYVLVQDADALAPWLERAREQGYLGIAVTTTGPRLEQTLAGVALALADGDACYIPLGHAAPSALDLASGAPPKQIGKNAAFDLLGPLLADPAVLKVGHDVKQLHRVLDLPIASTDDVMLLSYALEGGLHGHDLDELAQLHFGHETVKLKSLVGSGKKEIAVAEVPVEQALPWAAEQADLALRLHKRLKPLLVGARVTSLYETIERPLVPVIADMERRGVKVDRAALNRLSAEFAKRISDLETEIFKLAGRAFNVGSPKQLGVVLFEEQKLPSGRKTKTGDWATGSEILEPLAEQYDLPARVLDWRQTSKLKSTYADALVDEINPKTQRVHTSFALAASSTGRLSSNDPNLQNIPVRTEEGRLIRSAFVAKPGHKLLSVDYGQIELRLLAEIADIQLLKDAFREGADIHALTASQVFEVPLKDLDKETRRKAKAINFGIIYGISAFGLSKYLGCAPGEAQDYIRAYFERYPGVRVYMDECRAFARRHGFVRTLFGRKVHVPGINEKNPAKRGFAERQAINAPIQGSAADIIKRAMLRVPGAIAAQKLDAQMLLQIHDELLFEVPEAQVEATSEVVRKVMESAVSLSVPLVAEAGSGATWAEAH